MPYIGYEPAKKPLTSADITDSVITSAKITDGTIAIADLSATGTASSSTFLRGDNSWSTPAAGGITEADMWRISATKNLATASWEDLTANWERADTLNFNFLGTGMSQSSGIFTFPSTGKYLITMYGQLGNYSNNVSYCMFGYQITTNNSTYTLDDGCQTDLTFKSGSGGLNYVGRSIILDVTNTTNVKIKFSTYSSNANTFFTGSTSTQNCGFLFIKLGS